MKVLVTGASGMIGRALCDALFARGDEVVGLSRDPGKAREANPRVEWVRWEPTLERPPGEAFEGVDGVVNLVGETIGQRWNDDVKRRIMDSRRTATRNLVQAIEGLEHKLAALVSQSAIGFYGDRGDELLDEGSTPGSDYGSEVVQEWEQAARGVEAAGARLAIVRAGPVLDPRGGFLRELLTPFKLGVGGPLAGGAQWVSWVHRDDEIGILLWALDDETVSGVVNATAPAPVTNREFARTLGRVLGRPALLPIPGIVLDLKFGPEFGRIARGGQRVTPKRTRELGYEFRHPELEAALRDLL